MIRLALISTYYDYELKREAFKLSGEKGYVRETSTLFTLQSITNTNINYCTATFKVDVLGDRDTSQVAFYDNDNIIPFYISGTKYDYLEWDTTKSNVTISFRLSYETSHNIQARYEGNIRCVPSKSKTRSIYRNKPATATTTLSLAFSNTNKIYAYNSDIQCTATLGLVDSSTNSTRVRSQTIKFYVDGVLNGTATTPSDGNTVSYTFSNVGVGLHSISAVYEGSQYLFPCETSSDVSKGAKITILEYPRYVVNDGSITVKAQITSYFDSVLPNRLMSIATSDNTSLQAYGTSDSNGVATFTMASSKYLNIATTENNMKSIQYRIKYNDSDYSDVVKTIDAQNMTITLDDAIDYVSATNQSVEISGTVTPNRTGLFPLDITMSANGLSEVVRTNNSGAFTYKYKGIGVGDTSVTASINGASDSVNVEDVLQYWNANNTSWNKKYSWIIGEFRELTNGFKLSLPSSSSEGRTVLGLSDGAVVDYDYELSFKIISGVSLIQFGVSQWKKGTSNTEYNHTNTNTLVANGDVIKAVSEDDTFKVYKNNVLISSATSRNYPPSIWFEGNKKGAYILFDNLKYKVI